MVKFFNAGSLMASVAKKTVPVCVEVNILNPITIRTMTPTAMNQFAFSQSLALTTKVVMPGILTSMSLNISMKVGTTLTRSTTHTAIATTKTTIG